MVKIPQEHARLMTLRLRAISRFCTLVTSDDSDAEKVATWVRVTGEVLLAEQMRNVATGNDLDEEAFAQVMANVDLNRVLSEASDPERRQQLDPLRSIHERHSRKP